MAGVTLTSLQFGLFRDGDGPPGIASKGRKVHLEGLGRSALPPDHFTIYVYVVGTTGWWMAAQVPTKDVIPGPGDTFMATAYLKLYEQGRGTGDLTESTSTSPPVSSEVGDGPSKGTGELTVSTSTSDPTTPPQPTPPPQVMVASMSIQGLTFFFPVT